MIVIEQTNMEKIVRISDIKKITNAIFIFRYVN